MDHHQTSNNEWATRHREALTTRHSHEDVLNDREFELLLEACEGLPAPRGFEARFICLLGGRLGLRAGEITHFRTTWIDWNRKLIRIPKEDSSKNRENWYVGLTERTADALRRWLRERENYEMYHETDPLWLTRERNPYQSQSLRYLLKRLCEIADIPTENRKMSWYAIRHSLGTYMTAERDLKAAQSQLRHKSPQTTMRYD